MRAFNSIDFVVQGLVLVPVFVLFFFKLFTGHVDDLDKTFAYTIMIIGPWQFISSVITFFAKAPYYSFRKVHFAISTLYVSVVSILMIASRFMQIHEVSEDMIYAVVGIPVSLCMLYYYITLKTFSLSRSKAAVI
jgi:hypothetical protein